MSIELKPKRIRLEASSVCQLKCPSCPTASQAVMPAIGSGFLRLDDFRRLLDDNPRIREIELSNYGEIFLNPEILEIIKLGYKRKVVLTADNGVNLNAADMSVLEGMVKYRFKSLTCSIDGASDETYKLYRVNGDFEKVIVNIKTINLFKKRYRSKYPLLVWQFVIFGHNEHEIPGARRLARELNMEFRLKLSWDDELSPVRDPGLVRKEAGYASRDEFKRERGIDYVQGICHQLWDQPQINWDGKVLGCCRNFWADFGRNAFHDGLLCSINSEKMLYAREMLTGKESPRDDIPCTTCSIYQNMRADSRWLDRSLSHRALRSIPRRLKLDSYYQYLRKIFSLVP